jgi:hypothetical protein
MCNKVCHTVRESGLTVNYSLIFKPKHQCIVHLFFFTYDKSQDKYLSKFYTYDRVVIHIKLGQFLHLKIIVNIFCETLYGLNFTLTIIFYSMNFCEKGCRFLLKVIHVKWTKSVLKFIQLK